MSLLRHVLSASFGIGLGVAIGLWLRPTDEVRAAQTQLRTERVPRPARAIPTGRHVALGPPPTEREERLADVRAEIEDLQHQRDALLGTPEPIYAPSQATLEEWARCAQVHADVPSQLLTRGDGDWFSPALVGNGVLTEEERLELEQAAATFETESRTRLANIYTDASGEDPVTERSTPEIITGLRGLQRLLDPDEEQRRFVAEERAGVPHTPDADPDGSLVPYYRTLASLGDEFERTVANVVGRERARALRAEGNGWGGHFGQSPRCTE